MGLNYAGESIEKRLDGEAGSKMLDLTAQTKARLIGHFYEFNERFETYRIAAEAVKVDSGPSLKMAVEISAKLRKLGNEVEKRRKELVAPFLERKKIVDDVSARIKGQVGNVVQLLDDASRPYLQHMEVLRRKKEMEAEAQRREAMAVARREAEENRRKMAEAARAEASGAGEGDGSGSCWSFGLAERVSPVPIVMPEVVPDQTKVETASGSVTVKTEKVPEVVNLAAAVADPEFIRSRAKFLEGQVLIYARQCLKMGKLNIPGVVFTDTMTARGRVR